jgi:tripartite-type tricarboxylate transporter receptor subunit TctC
MHLVRALLSACLALATQQALAQAWPAKPLRMVVPFSPGAGTDALARIVGQKMADNLGQSLVVDNRPGAGGSIGTEIVAKAPADGYTLLFAPASHAINPGLYPKLAYDTLKDFTTVSMVASLPVMLGVESSLPARSVAELVALAKAKPGTLSAGSAGNGTVFHLVLEMFKRAAGVDIVHVPFKGGAPAMAALAGAQVSMAFETSLTLQPHVRSGKVRALAIASAQRASLLPDVPTLAEAGYPGIIAENWYALHVPAGTPPDIVRRLNAEVAKATAAADVREKLAAQGAEVRQSTQEQAAAFVRDETAKWTRIIRESGTRID